MPRTRGHHIPLLVTAPRVRLDQRYTVASEIGDIERFASPAKLCGYGKFVNQRTVVHGEPP